MCLLKKEVTFYWNERAQRYFEVLKKALSSAPILSPPNYNKYFILYLAASESTIGMVLVQDDENIQEHVIYYLSTSLANVEISYAHAEKLALEVVHAAQRL